MPTKSNLQRKSMGPLVAFFLLVLSFNVFLQFDIAERLFNALSGPADTIALNEPLCGLSAQISSGHPSDSFIREAMGASGCVQTSAKTKAPILSASSIIPDIPLHYSVFPIRDVAWASVRLHRYDGLSPPLA